MSKAPSTPATASPTSASPMKAPAQANPLRMKIMLAVLGVVVALWCYDFFVAKPATVKAEKDMEAMFNARNAKGVRKTDGEKIQADFVKPADVQALLKKSPLWTDVGKEKGKEYVIECYWWGVMPHRNYITVMYHGVGDNLRFNSQHRDSKPDPKEDYPTIDKTESKPPLAADIGEAGDRKKGPGEGSLAPPMPKETIGDAPPTTDKPTEPKPAVEKPAEPKPVEPKPAEEKPAEEKPAEPKSAVEKPAEPKPTEEKPAEPKPAEPKPAVEKPKEE